MGNIFKMSKLSSLLDKLMIQQDLSESELSRRTGISQPAIHRLVSGKNNNPKLTTLLPIANFFKISLSQLIGEDELPKNLLSPTDEKSYSHLAKVSLLEWKDILEWPKNKKLISTLEYKCTTAHALSENSYALKIEDNAMSPIYPEGTIIIVDPLLEPKNNDLAIIYLNNHKTSVFRQLLIDINQVYIKPFNPDLKNILLNKNYKILGVVVQSINHLY